VFADVFHAVIGNESVPKIVINDAINFIFFKLQSVISILPTLNHNSFRVLFDKIASVYFIFEKYTYILALEMPAQGTSTVPILSAHFRSLYGSQQIN